MDYVTELLLLSFDAIIVGFFSKAYYDRRKAAKAVKSVGIYDVNSSTISTLSNQTPTGQVPYCALRGIVQALGTPIRSIHAKDISGVIHRVRIKEHVVSRGALGYWFENERPIQDNIYAIPFVLQVGLNNVEIVEPLVAEFIELETITDAFEPKTTTFMDFIWGFFVGSRQRGFQYTEEMLREGSLITAIGTLTLSEDKKMLRMEPPSNDLPFFLTPLSLSSLTKRLEEQKTTYKYVTVAFGLAGAAIIGTMTYKWWKKREELRKEAAREADLERSRPDRRARVREPRDYSENELCVVCRTNPREIIVLPCGHVCLCEDCSGHLTGKCPVCRTDIKSRTAAYL